MFLLMSLRPAVSQPVPYTTLFRSLKRAAEDDAKEVFIIGGAQIYEIAFERCDRIYLTVIHTEAEGDVFLPEIDRKRTRLNSSHVASSYAVFCLKKNTATKKYVDCI